MSTSADSELLRWANLSEHRWPTLLLGNGASVNLWRGFQYGSLYEKADLSTSIQEIFANLGTSNFETVLECLHHAHIVNEALGESNTTVDAAYDEVRDSLLRAVNESHVRRSDFPNPTHTVIAQALAEHRSVFTTNYDLCLYWSQLQSDPRANIKDYFWGSGRIFNRADTEVWEGATALHYLHGGLHLWSDDATGDDGKWTSNDGNLLGSLQDWYSPGASRRPLFVSEGTSQAKVRTIRRSSYLSFCLDQLRSVAGNVVVFGHSLSDQDAHIVEALNAHVSGRRIAVSILPDDDTKRLNKELSRIRYALSRHDVEFFDATTHPLGSPRLSIQQTTGPRD